MQISKKDVERLSLIKRHCERVAESIARYGNTYDVFLHDFDFRDSVSMNIFSATELLVSLSDELRRQIDLPWEQIKGLRNRFAHGYGVMDKEIIWQVASSDMPAILEFCLATLSQQSI